MHCEVPIFYQIEQPEICNRSQCNDNLLTLFERSAASMLLFQWQITLLGIQPAQPKTCTISSHSSKQQITYDGRAAIEVEAVAGCKKHNPLEAARH